MNICGHTFDEKKFKDIPIALDLGGYDGDFAIEFLKQFPFGYVITLEPTPNLCVSHNGRWIVINKAAWTYDGKTNFFVNDNAHFKNSILIKGGRRTTVETMDIVPLFKIFYFDIIKVDIEGAEYELIDHLIKTDALRNQKNAQLSIEFHDFLDHSLLAKTNKTISDLNA